MAKKSIGYAETEWVCPNCANKNPGSRQACAACGSPQPQDVAFRMRPDAALLEDSAALEAARQAADTHCPYCGTRNSAGAKLCQQCGGDLSEGARRQAGKVLLAAGNAQTLICPACGAENAPDAGRCVRCGGTAASVLAATPAAGPLPNQPGAGKRLGAGMRPWMAIPLIALILMCCVVVGFFYLRTEALSGLVQRVAWERTIVVEDLRPVTRETWRDQIPADAETLACRQEVRSSQEQPAPNAREVCGTPYSVDKGNGYAEVVQDCVYEVYDDMCQYSALEWQAADQATAQGDDLFPAWPLVDVSATRREGARSEHYWAYFQTTKGVLEYEIPDSTLFGQFLSGSEWLLTINGLGQVVDVARP